MVTAGSLFYPRSMHSDVLVSWTVIMWFFKCSKILNICPHFWHMKFSLWLWCSFYLSLRYLGQKIKIFYLLFCILNPCIFKIFLQLKLVVAGQDCTCWIYFHNICKLCGLEWEWISLCSFVSEHFVTFCTHIEQINFES